MSYLTSLAALRSLQIPTLIAAPFTGIVTRTGETYGLTLADAGAYVKKTHSANHILAIQLQSVVAYPNDFTTIIRNESNFFLTLVFISGNVATYPLGALTVAPYESRTLVRQSTNNWNVL